MFQILIVEDDKELSQLFQKVLEKNGYQVKSASDGAQALEVLDKEHRPVFFVSCLDFVCGRLRGRLRGMRTGILDVQYPKYYLYLQQRTSSRYITEKYIPIQNELFCFLVFCFDACK